MAGPILIVPGLSGSGPAHWQSHWERLLPDAHRVVQADWDNPTRAPWLERFTDALDSRPGAVVVAHSLGCAVVANAVHDDPSLNIGAALLVSPTDVDRADDLDIRLRDFAPMPLGPLPFTTIVAASRNDPFVGFDRARFFAGRWGAEFVDVGEKGHINAESALGDWPEGMAILERLMSG